MSIYSSHCFKYEITHALLTAKAKCHLQGQAYKNSLPKVSSAKNSISLVFEYLPRRSGCVMLIACVFERICGHTISQRRALLQSSLNGHALHSGPHAKVRYMPIRALDLKPNNTKHV